MRNLTQLPIPVPLSLEMALGYEGEGRYLAAWWEPAGDEVMISDGRTTEQGWWYGYLAYVRHPKVEPHLDGYDLGHSESPADHYLLFDLVERKAYVGEAWEVTAFLRENTPRRNLSPEQVDQVLEHLYAPPFVVNMAAIEREAKRRTEAVNAMIEELNR